MDGMTINHIVGIDHGSHGEVTQKSPTNEPFNLGLLHEPVGFSPRNMCPELAEFVSCTQVNFRSIFLRCLVILIFLI